MDPDFASNAPVTPLSNAEKSEQLRDMEAQKSDQIDRIATSVQVQKKLAYGINTEIEEQAPLLDEITDKNRAVDTHIQKTTKKVDTVRLRAADKVSILVIGILLVCLVIVILLAIFL
ncbi:syntaxin, putative [Entamoeba invadens IP1]|uniref:syntaxin, putative n=1 Tax=Entamoeba invadens IP1 TaxID=370355 RepID=UPI0002C3EEE8|nr:syntaxin, putative [Entamoeba invadens IP1]ELP93290.1 syntaxin, putative [Entamoeba invadens IP1]|eukprot:XP_004260061.1 syntaxin, putative [Entamoeba invadens IP1]